MSATLKSEIPGGAIQSQRVDKDVTDYLAGRTVEQRLCISVVQIASVTLENQQKGRVSKPKYETVHMVEVRDPHEIDSLRYRITQLKANQGFETQQPGLFALSDAEQCENLIDQIRDWGSERDLGVKDLDKKWHEILGGGGQNVGLAESFVACRSPQQLKDFAYTLGVISDNPVEEKPEEETPETETPEDETPAEPTDTAPSEAPEQPDTAPAADATAEPVAAGGVPFTDVTDQS